MKLLVNRKDISSYEDIKDELVKYYCSCKPEVTTGADHAGVILGWANGWNQTLRDYVCVAAQNVVSALDFELASDAMHELSLAARAADNQFSPYGEYGLLMDKGCGFPTFGVVLTDWQLEDIREKPEDYDLYEFSVN